MADIINLLLQKLHNYQGKKRAHKKEPDYTESRKFVGKIYIGVLTEKITVKEGLLMFPKEAMGDFSIQAAWHALCHYEADEDIRARDIQYCNEQQELLELVAFTFKDGKPLPQNIIASYEKYYDEALIEEGRGLRAIFSKLTRNINI